MRTIGFLSLCAIVNAGCFGDFCEQFGLGADCPGVGPQGGGGTGGNGGDNTGGNAGGEGGVGGMPPLECLPADGEPIGTECGVFVEEGQRGNGTQDLPYGSVLEAVANIGDKSRIYICGEGAFTGSVALPAGVSVYGSLTCGTWVYAPNNPRPRIIGTADEPAVRITGGTAKLVSINIEALDAVANGKSSIALLIAQATVDIDKVELVARNGRVGAAPPGKPGQLGPAAPGQTGSNASASAPAVANAPGGTGTCDGIDLAGGVGGNGGPPPNVGGGNGNAGDFPTPGGGGVGGTGQGAGSLSCSVGLGLGGGATGEPGDTLMSGTGGIVLGTLSASGITAVDGGPGDDGTHGHSGGGGGGSRANATIYGAGGGGGGAGGCGGVGGPGGKGGGSSIALISFDATVTMTSEVGLTVGIGGDGANGGEGQFGQPGGGIGTGGMGMGTVVAACNGGAGGPGGSGGNGGGGRGGHAIAIAFTGNEPTGGTPHMDDAAPGDPGQGGDNGGDPGDPGLAGELQASLGF